MTFNETMGLISDRFGRRITVSISGMSERGPATAMSATGTLAPGFSEAEQDAMHHNEPHLTIQAFSLEEAPDVLIYCDPSEFRDARVHMDKLSVHVGEDVEISFQPALR